MLEDIDNSGAINRLRSDLERYSKQLIVVEKKDLISHGLSDTETIIRMAYIGIISDPFLNVAGTRLFILSSAYSAILSNGESVLFHHGRPPMGSYPFEIDSDDFARKLISRQGVDYGFSLTFTIGNKAVLSRSRMDSLYRKDIDEFCRYSQIAGTP